MNFNRRSATYFSAIALLAVFLVWGCSTEKDAWLNRTFHNTTARYNGYFNANELIKEALFTYEESYKEDYTRIIPIYIYADDVGSKSLYPAMDTAIKKCATVINKHSMPEKKEGEHAKTEWCKWIDDNWMVIGQAHFHKRDYGEAIDMFEYVMEQYETEEISFEAKLWAAKTLIEAKNYNGAAKYLIKLDEEVTKLEEEAEKDKSEKDRNKELGISKKKKKKRKRATSRYKVSRGKSRKKKSKDDEENKPAEFPEELSLDVHIVMADLHIRRKEWQQASERLKKAIDEKPKKKLRTRLYFILAQIEQQNGNAEGASEHYTKVIKMNPDYEMTFYAKINRALSGGGNTAELREELEAMAKDEKNQEYLDQIYYALADLDLQEGDKEGGITYLQKSAEASTDNLNQKTKTYLRLANIFFDDKNYEPAQAYYDSTARVVPKDHPDYEQIIAKNKSLTELVENIQTVALQDSLQRLGRMSKTEQEEVVQKIIEDMKAEEERKRQEAIQKQIDQALADAQNASKGGKFWPYNPQLRGTGFSDFKKKWGDRKNEDDWRRSDKSQELTNFFNNGDGEEGDSINANVSEKYNPATYLANIPKTEEDYRKSDLLIQDALYGQGVVYKDDLKDYKESEESFLELITRYPKSRLAPSTLYQLYRLGELDLRINKERHRKQLLKDFPDSQEAMLIKDPKYIEKLKEQEAVVQREYEQCYKDFKYGNYNAVILKANQMAGDTTLGEYECKYMYLKALAVGKISNPALDPAAFEKALGDVIKNCKGSDVATAAQRTMDLIKNTTSVIDAGEGTSTYIYDAEAAHFFIYVHDKSSGSINPIKTNVSNFNSSSFSSKGLTTSSNFLNPETQVVMVRAFKDKTEAMDYYTAFRANKTQLKNFNSGDNFYAISAKNYASLLVEKKDAEYKAFFNKNYLDL